MADRPCVERGAGGETRAVCAQGRPGARNRAAIASSVHTIHEGLDKTELELAVQDLQCIAKPKAAEETASVRQGPAVPATG